MINLTKNEIDKLLEEYQASKTTEISIEKYFQKKAILGFDIYRYSQYPTLEQTLIPHLFKKIFNWSIKNCLEHEPYLFQDITKEDFLNQFIDTGDGGFQIFDTPFQAVIFAMYFQANIKRYNSVTAYTETLYKIVGEITLRYALTYDTTFCYEKNYYGPSIINNARIMSKDKLNRFLLDDATVKWFTQEINGLENLQVITFEDDFKNIEFLKKLKIIEGEKIQSLIFTPTLAKILKVDLLKIGEIKSKLDTLSVHNLHIQILMHSGDKGDFKKYTVSLGNLNLSGITE